MAKTQAQWLTKLKAFVPRWFYEEEYYQEAFSEGLAKILVQLEEDIESHISDTMLTEASGLVLDAHGDERSIDRATDEYDAQYSIRVRNMANRSNRPAIKALVDQLLMAGVCTIIEDYEASIFCDRDHYVSRNELLVEQIYNSFSIIVDKQLHDPYSFADREYFVGREDYLGQAESSQYVFDLILETVNKVKASGCLYRIIERRGSYV